MTKLPDSGELEIRRLDDEDDDAERVFMTEVAPHLPGLPMPGDVGRARAFMLLAREGLLEHLAPPKRKRGERRRAGDNMLDLIIEDAHRLRLSSWLYGADFKLKVAAERHLRNMRGYCRIDDLGEIDDLVAKLRRRLRGSGTTGAERARRSSRTCRAKS